MADKAAPAADAPPRASKKKEDKKNAKLERIAAAKARKEQQEQQKKGQQEQQSNAEPAKKIRLREEFVNTTKLGEKKDLSGPMPDAYHPAQVEAAWYDWWQAQRYFEADVANKDQFNGKFVMVIPPPNVTGSLHLGHALTNAVEDTICRYHRMKGKQVLWVPGCDHAGIATQVVVEKQLMREQKLTRHDLGREKFIEKVWEWKNQKGDRIYEQLKRLGSSLDWRRAAFTLDDIRQTAVMEAFVRMYNDGLIYRQTRLVNWCCALKTAISDIEVEVIELNERTKRKVPGYPGKFDFGIIEDFGYEIVDEQGNAVLDDEGKPAILVIATTRLETMLGDTAVAVHPDDPRYKKWHGKYVFHPYRRVRLPIILDDELVKMDKGTGCVKVTPAHDPFDYQAGKRHGLPFINILTDDGLINENGGEAFAGMKRYDARIAIRKDLQARGRHYAIRDNKMLLAVCSRSGDVIEPMLKPQWWVNCDAMAKEAIRAVRDKDIEIIPAKFVSTWNYWMENIQPWCISRQLWWGHRIPAWLVHKKSDPRPIGDTNSDWIVARTLEEAQKEALSRFPGCCLDDLVLSQDEDVLDTWFSSGLFPFSVFGWPNDNPDLSHFYPIELMETGNDILFFWVARMVMMGWQLTGKLPFKQIFLHSIVRDAHGRKMSKTLGNVIDPIDVIEGITLEQLHETLKGGNLDPMEIETAMAGQKKDFPNGISECGTDALRLTLCTYTSQGVDINLNVNQIVADRNFCNKMWNVVKFAMKFFPADFAPPNADFVVQDRPHRKEDAWILSRLRDACEKANSGFEEFQLGRATLAVKDFILNHLCDVYLEAMKPLMYTEPHPREDAASLRSTALSTLYTCLDVMFRLLHPFMPFVTEELWQRLPRRPTDPASIMIAPYPSPNPQWGSAEVESEVAVVLDVIRATRRVRAEYGLTKQKPKMYIRTGHAETFRIMEDFAPTLLFLCQASDLTLLREGEAPDGTSNVIAIVPGRPAEVAVGLEGMVDFDKEVASHEKKVAGLDRQIAALEKKRSDATYAAKVPEFVRAEEADKLSSMQDERARAADALHNMRVMRDAAKQPAQ